jgi:hypothetical protein
MDDLTSVLNKVVQTPAFLYYTYVVGNKQQLNCQECSEFTRENHEPTKNNGCGPLPKGVGYPCFNIFYPFLKSHKNQKTEFGTLDMKP